MSLYRIYRPKDFPSFVGQNHVKTTLLNALQSGKTAHAYLFTGPRGTGKTTAARLFAKGINSDKMTAEGVFDGCEIAGEIDEGKLIDVIEIDAASNRGIDEIRDLREKINFSPTRARNKVYIIDEVHMLTKEAFNALLKTLEEPPSFVYFVLATTEIHKVPETIISRCQRFDFKRIQDVDIVDRLRFVASSENVQADDEALEVIARQSRGGMRDALTMMEQLIVDGRLEIGHVQRMLGLSQHIVVRKIFDLVCAGKASDAVKKISELYQQGIDLNVFCKDFLEFLRQEMLKAVHAGKKDEAEKIMLMIDYFQDAQDKMRISTIAQLPLEVAVIRSGIVAGGKLEASPVETAHLEVAAPEKVVVEPTPEPKAAVEAAPQKNEVALEAKLVDFVKNWTQIGERIHNPVIRRSLMMAEPTKLAGNRLTITFADNFNKEKLFSAEHLAIAEQAIEDELKCHVKLDGVVDVKRNVLAKDDSEVGGSVPTGSGAVNSAMDVFGDQLA